MLFEDIQPNLWIRGFRATGAPERGAQIELKDKEHKAVDPTQRLGWGHVGILENEIGNYSIIVGYVLRL